MKNFQKLKQIIINSNERKIFFNQKIQEIKKFFIDKNRLRAGIIFVLGNAPYVCVLLYGLFTSNMDNIPKLVWQITNWTCNITIGLTVSFISNKNKRKPTMANIIFPILVNMTSSIIAYVIGVPMEVVIPGFLLGQTAAFAVRRFMQWEHKQQKLLENEA